MKTTHESLQSPRSAWGRFWFQPTDPTVLGFMRIVTGLVAFYIHLAYCYDLTGFFGPDAFVDQESAYKTRREAPMLTYSFWDWQASTDKPTAPPAPIMPDRRAAVFDFLRGLPETKGERNELLYYLYYVLDTYGKYSGEASQTLTFSGLSLAKDAGKLEPDQRQRMLDALTRKEFVAQQVPLTLPLFFFHQNVSQEDRIRLWQSVLRLSDFLWALPALQDPDYQVVERRISFVLRWMFDLTPAQRHNLVQFLQELPEGEESRKILNYWEYWRYDPREVYDQGNYTFSIWYHLQNPKAMWAVHIIVLVIFLLFTLGVFTRVTSVLAWLAALQYIHRTQQVLFGMDTMMNILLFYLMIGPSGAALSVDRLLARYRAAKAIFKAGGKSVPWAEAVLAGPQPSATANFAIRLFQIHFCIIYAAAGLAKLKGPMWWDTRATWYTIANPEFTPMNYRFYEETLRWIAQIKPLLLICWALFTYFTLFMEITFAFLIWTRLRPLMVSLAILLHAGIAIIMGLACFQLLMLALLLCYIPASTIRNRLFWQPGTGPKMVMHYDGRNRRHMRLVAFVRALDLTGQVAVHDESSRAKTQAGVELIGIDGRHHTGYGIIQHIFANLLFARTIRWLLYLPGVGWLIRSLTYANGESIPVNGVSASSKVATAPTVTK